MTKDSANGEGPLSLLQSFGMHLAMVHRELSEMSRGSQVPSIIMTKQMVTAAMKLKDACSLEEKL